MNSATAFLSTRFGSVCNKVCAAVKRTFSNIGKAARDIWEVGSDKLGGFLATEAKKHRKRTGGRPLDKGSEVQKPYISAVCLGHTLEGGAEQVPSFILSFSSGLKEEGNMQLDGRLVMAVPSSQSFSELATSEPFLRKPLTSSEEENKDFVARLGYFMEQVHVGCSFAESALKAKVLYLEEILPDDSGKRLGFCGPMEDSLGNTDRWNDSEQPPTLRDFASAFFFMKDEARRYRWAWPRGSPCAAGDYAPRK